VSVAFWNATAQGFGFGDQSPLHSTTCRD
jgi:hypothetical protein